MQSVNFKKILKPGDWSSFSAQSGQALTAGMRIGNPFTDGPELCAQAIVVTDNDPETSGRAALEMAEAVLDRSDHEGTRTFANAVLTSQQSEIDLMTEMLAERGE